MRKGIFILIIFCLVTIVNAETINRGFIYVPADYDSIQSAIDASLDEDEIIVSPGTYMENINFNGKAITVASLFYTTQDTSYITQTVIDGGQLGSVVTFDNGEGANSVLTGFTITNGYSTSAGGGIFTRDYCSPTLNNLQIINNQAESYGGGFYFGQYSTTTMEDVLIESNSAHNGGGGAYSYYCDLIMEDSIIRNNVSESCGGGIYAEEANLQLDNILIENNSAINGGGIYFSGWSGYSELYSVFIHMNQANNGGGIYTHSEIYLENVTITNNLALSFCGGLYCSSASVTFAEEISKRCSIYQNEGRNGIGNDIYSNYTQEVYLTAFSVLHPTNYYAEPLNHFTFDILFGVTQQIDADLYVSPAGNDENSGLSADSPLQTIEQAGSLICPSTENPHTIHLGAGIYSNSATGERFPVYLPDHVNLRGENRENVILDAEESSRVMQFSNDENITVSGITLTNGNGYYGGGIYCQESNLTLDDMKIINNSAVHNGGGILMENSNTIFKNLIIADNIAEYSGGGIYDDNCNSVFSNITVTGNAAGIFGGGIYSYDGDTIIINSIFWNNSPLEIYSAGFEALLTIAYSDIKEGEAGVIKNYGFVNWLDGILEENPLFVDAENGDFRLMAGSPCIDAGTAYLEYDGLVLVNLEEEEYWGIAPDMGAYEYFIITDNDDEEILPGAVSMYNYPNPFNPETTVCYQLAESGKVSLEVYNIKGQKVAVLLDKEQEAGEHDLTWDAAGMNSGIYFIRLSGKSFQKVNKVILLK